jgi:hypothetical protein
VTAKHCGQIADRNRTHRTGGPTPVAYLRGQLRGCADDDCNMPGGNGLLNHMPSRNRLRRGSRF